MNALMGQGQKDWKQFFVRGEQRDTNLYLYTCLLCLTKEGYTGPVSYVFDITTSEPCKDHVLSHDVDEVRTFLSGLSPPFRNGPRLKAPRKARALFRFCLKQKVSFHAVETPEFKALAKEFGIDFPSSRKEASRLIQSCVDEIYDTKFPNQTQPLLASLVLDSWADKPGVQHYSVSVHTKAGTETYGQYVTKERQDAQWLARIFSQIITELAERNYHVIGLTADDTPVIAAAWECIGSRLKIRQTCISHLMNLCLEKALNDIGAVSKMREARGYFESMGVRLHTSCSPMPWYSAGEAFRELLAANAAVGTDSHMNHYVELFEKAEKLADIVADFLAIARRKDASLFVVAVAFLALDKATGLQPFVGLRDAVREMWEANPDLRDLFSVVILMSPCFFEDRDMCAYWKIPTADARKSAIRRLSDSLGLEVRDDVLMQLSMQTGLFNNDFPPVGGCVFEAESHDSAGGDTGTPAGKKSENRLLSDIAICRCLALQQASVQWWRKISARLQTSEEHSDPQASIASAIHQSYMNLSKLWEILMAIRPAKVAIERISDTDEKILAPKGFHLSPALLDSIVLLGGEENSQ